MESKSIYIIVRESVSRGFSGTLVSPWFYDAFSDAAERMKKMLSDEKRRFSDEAEVSFSGDDQCVISEGPAHSVTLRIEKLEEYRKEQPSCRYNAVDLGLPSGMKWCDRNVGAASPEAFGDYFAWGETKPRGENWATEAPYDWAHAPFNGGSSEFDKEYFKANSGTWLTDGDTLKPEYDAAYVNMGGSWRMPTQEEMLGLLGGTTQTMETLNGVYGIRFSSKTNGNSIFMPFCGSRDGSDVYNVGNGGFAWSSSLHTCYSYGSRGFHFYDLGVSYVYSDYRCLGFVVRGVCA